MRILTLKSTAKVLLLALAVLFLNSISYAQYWNGRRYINEDPELCHQVIMKQMVADKDYKDMPQIEREAVVTLLSMTDIRIGIVFKSKNRFVMSVMMSINNKLAHAADMGREEIEQANAQLMQLSADMKTTGTYTIDGNKLSLNTKEDNDVIDCIILDDGQRIQASDKKDKIVFKRQK